MVSHLRHISARRMATAIVLAMVLAVAGQLAVSYASTLRQSVMLVQAMATAADHHLSASMRGIDSILDESARAVEDGTWDGADFRQTLLGHMRAYPEVLYIGRVDETGRLRPAMVPQALVPAEGVDVSDREYFRLPRDLSQLGASDDMSPTLFVGKPTAGRVSKRKAIHVARVVRTGAGKFGGVVVAVVDPDVYAGFLRTVLLDRAGLSAVFRSDGTLIAEAPSAGEDGRQAALAGALFRDFVSRSKSGVARLGSVFEGNDQIVGYRTMRGLPLVIATGVSGAKALAVWYRMALVETTLAVLFAIGIFYWAFQVDAARAEAHQASVAKSRFLAAASHDLRQPFQAMRLYHCVLTDLCREAPQRAVLVELDKAMRSGEELLTALLDVSTLEAGQVKPRRCVFPIREVLDAKATEFAPAAAEKGLDLRAIASDLVVESDPVLLKRMLGNLIANAIRYTEAGGILVGCRRRGRSVRLEVWDTGIGIPEDKLRAVFDEFYQVGNPERDRSKGLGLGLAVVERMARLLGHEISVRSQPGSGSVFSIQLPLARG